MKNHLISALVLNQSGVLTRVSGLFARRGYNIQSLAVCNTEDDKYSRMTIVAAADDATILQVIKQLDKLVDVIKVSELEPFNAVTRELLLIKVRVEPQQRPEISTTCDVYKAKIIDLSAESVIIEITGDSQKIDGFINLLKPYGIIEMARSGMTALERGKNNINDLTDYNETV